MLNEGGRYRHATPQRIDHIFVSVDLARRIVICDSAIVFNETEVTARDGRV